MTMVSRVKESCADLALPGCKSSRRPTGPQKAGTDLSKNLRAVSCLAKTMMKGLKLTKIHPGT